MADVEIITGFINYGYNFKEENIAINDIIGACDAIVETKEAKGVKAKLHPSSEKCRGKSADKNKWCPLYIYCSKRAKV